MIAGPFRSSPQVEGPLPQAFPDSPNPKQTLAGQLNQILGPGMYLVTGITDIVDRFFGGVGQIAGPLAETVTNFNNFAQHLVRNHRKVMRGLAQGIANGLGTGRRAFR